MSVANGSRFVSSGALAHSPAIRMRTPTATHTASVPVRGTRTAYKPGTLDRDHRRMRRPRRLEISSATSSMRMRGT